MNRRHFLSTAGLAAAGFTLGGCSRSNANTVKIVSSMPRTGSAKGQTDTIANAIRMAIDEYGGKVIDCKIEYDDLDDATASAGNFTPDLESSNARRAVADPDVMAYIGAYNSGACMVSMPILSEASLLQITPSSTWIGLTKKHPIAGPDEPEKYRVGGKRNFCRVCPTDETQGPMAADFAKNELKAKRVYILDDKDLYGKGVADLFKDQCKKIGLEVLDQESINVNQQEFVPLMTKIKEKFKPDVIYFGGTTQTKGGQIAKDMIAAGLDIPLIVPDGCYELSFIESAQQENLKNCYATMGGVDWPALKGPGAEFVKKFQAKFGKDPEAYAIYGYEAAKVALEAIAKAGKKDREEITKIALATKDFDKGALGKWSFDPEGDISLQNFTISKIEGGKFKPVLVVDKIPTKA